jgi:Dyp-type peroxidase family
MAVASTRLPDEALRDVQGFIASGYGHLPCTAYLFVRVNDAAEARRWIGRLAGSITSAIRWPAGADGRRIKPAAAVNVAFTAPGLSACGLPPAAHCTFPPEFLEGVAVPHRSRILGDTEESAPATWELGGTGTPPVHAVVIIHAATDAALDTQCDAQRRLLAESAGGVAELPGSMQRGHRPPNDREPFGFRDGIAQPAIAGFAGSGVPTGEFILGYENHYRSIPPTPVVPAELDPHGVLPPFDNPYHAATAMRDFGRNGSYVVYRKLQQDVAGFWRFMKEEAIRVRGEADPAYLIWLAAKFVGRWPSGAPLALFPDADDPRHGGRDDFLYGHDPAGLACPMGAHVRRANPRDGIRPNPAQQSRSMSEAHRLLRRGRVFGPPLFDPLLLQEMNRGAAGNVLRELQDDGRARGTHFLCVNASIRSQFEFVQQTWCNNPHFSGLHDNKDPIAGDAARAGEAPSRMTIPGRPTVRTAAFPRFVTVKAAGYFFMPSLTALRFLAQTPNARTTRK